MRKRLLLLSAFLKRLHFFSLAPQLRVAIVSAHTTAPRCTWGLVARFERCAVLFLHQRLSHLRRLGAGRAGVPEIQGHRRTVAERRGLSLLASGQQGSWRGLEAREECGSTSTRCEGAGRSGLWVIAVLWLVVTMMMMKGRSRGSIHGIAGDQMDVTPVTVGQP